MDSIQASETEALFSVLRQSADGDAVSAIEALVREAPDRALNRVNVLDFAVKNRLDEEQAIAVFLHAARVGLFDLSWNVLCPGCGGVLDATVTPLSRRSTPTITAVRCVARVTKLPSMKWSRFPSQ
jgi:hypothetical protein